VAKPAERTYSRYTLEAIVLLGRLIRLARIEKRMTAQELADRAGISRGLLQRIERGEPRCEIGAAFEVAAILGIPLFESTTSELARHARQVDDKLALLPKAMRQGTTAVDDEF